MVRHQSTTWCGTKAPHGAAPKHHMVRHQSTTWCKTPCFTRVWLPQGLFGSLFTRVFKAGVRKPSQNTWCGTKAPRGAAPKHQMVRHQTTTWCGTKPPHGAAPMVIWFVFSFVPLDGRLPRYRPSCGKTGRAACICLCGQDGAHHSPSGRSLPCTKQGCCASVSLTLTAQCSRNQ
jgi:hypothetical protein